MKKPEMILFDYGHTLVYEPSFDHPAGFRAVLARCRSNPRGITAEELAEAYALRLERLISASHAADCDYLDMAAKRLLYEERALEFDAELTELERLYWDAAGPGTAMPGADALLRELEALGIRSAVVSNMNFREANVKGRIDRLLPDNRFEFVLCSCEYATRKPRQDFFRLALRKAGLEADQVWFCGDNPRCDVVGAFEAGMQAVWYDNDMGCPYRQDADRVEVTVPCLHIREWTELGELLKKLS